MRTASFLSTVLLFAAFVPFEGAGASTYTVKPDGTGDFATIQAALDAATHGDTVLLADGIFRGIGNRDLDFRGKAITLRSESGNAENCVIDCEANATTPARGIRFHFGESPATVVDGLTITNGHAAWSVGDLGRYGGGILCEDNAIPTITRCRLVGNKADAYGGGICCVGSAASITWCTFLDNYAAEGGGGLARVFDSQYGLVTNCTVYRNAAPTDGAGILIAFGAQALIERTLVAGNLQSSGLDRQENSIAQLTCCDIYGNEGGDWVEGIAEQSGVNGNLWADPRFCSAEEGNLTLDVSSPCAPDNPNNPACDLIGAHPVDCDVPVLTGVSWGRIRGLFR